MSRRLLIGVGNVCIRLKPTNTCCPIASGNVSTSRAVRDASIENVAAPGRSALASVALAATSRRRRSIAPTNCSSTTVALPTTGTFN